MMKYVETNTGKIPIEDYREIFAYQHGFDSYQELRAAGGRIGDGYDEENCALYVDMDGTLTEFSYVNDLQDLYQQGYFLNLKPQQSVIEGITEFMVKYPWIPVYILSAFLGDSKYALQEKIEWMQTHMPQMPSDHYLFVKCGETKALVPQKDENANLLDDYSKNLLEWENAGFHGIKLLNGINGKGRTWKGDKLSKDLSPSRFADRLYHMMIK